ncbi:MAG: calcium-binding protein [Planctomycetota bacterium]
MIHTVTETSASIEAFAVVAPPLKPQTQEGRILVALGLLRGPLPHAVTKWLIRYHEYLSSRMCFPFEARCPEETGVLRPWTSIIKVVELLAPSVRSAQDGAGLRCIAFRGSEQTEIPLIDLDVENDHPNVQLIEDYWYWFWNWQFDPQI